MSNKIIDIGKHVVMYEGKLNTNIICVELESGLVFVDSGRQDDAAKEFRETMEKKFKKKATHLLLTHYHHDHISGMSAFKDVEIIGSKAGLENYKNDLKGRLSKEQRQAFIEQHKKRAEEGTVEVTEQTKNLWKYYPTVDLFAPTNASNKIELGTDDRKIIFKTVGGHSECSAIIYIPSEKIVIIGDNLTSNPTELGPCFFGGLNQNILEIYQKIQKLDFDVIIPGHGPKTDRAYLNKVYSYLEKLFVKLLELYEKGVSPFEIGKHESLPEFYDKPPIMWDRAIMRLYNKVALRETTKATKLCKDKLIKADEKNDIEAYLEIYVDDFTILWPNGLIVHGKDDFRRCFRKTDTTDYKYETTEQYFLGDKYIEKSNFTFKDRTSGTEKKIQREYIYHWKREAKQWKLELEIFLAQKELE